ncbi:MAG TPA: hypothetical protein VMZ53_33580 [Kofleriaceae bacterium]|nr:hypothetical protein [Kofleriaceae bacterium]
MRRLAFLLAAVATGCGPDTTTGACKDNLLPGDLVITEVFADFAAPAGGTGTDDGKEWFEVYNNADRPVSLKGVTVVHSRPDGSKAATHTMTDVTVAPGQFFTLGNSTSDLVPAYVDYGYSADLGDFFNSDGGKLTLKCGDDEIDNAVYEMVKSGHSRQLSNAGPPDYTLNDELVNWCEAKDTEFESGNFGTPGEDNDCAPVIAGACSDGGSMRAVVPPVSGDLVITELMPNPAAVSDTVGEWFEIKAINPIDLNGVKLERLGNTPGSDTLTSSTCLHLAAGSYGVFVKSTDNAMNGMIPAGSIMGVFKFALTASSAPGVIQVSSGGAVLDTVQFTAEPSGKSRQLDPDSTDAIANDAESNFCDGTTPYGAGDLGTPGAANTQCGAVAPPGMCMGTSGLRAIVKPPAGKLVISELMINPMTEVPTGTQEWFEITNTGTTAFDLNGLGIDQASTTRAPDVISSSDCKSVAPNGFALLAHTANTTLPGVDATYGFGLSNSGGELQVLDGTTVLDSVAWTSVTATMYESKSMQLDPDFLDPAMNDLVIGTGSKWCVGATAYDGTNQGTPKAANAQCAGL